MKVSLVRLILTASLTIPAVLLAADAASDKAAPATVWDGVYTADQAARGQKTFTATCAGCHKAGFTGASFMQHWSEDKLSSLYDFISTSMPAGAPGSAGKQNYLDIVAWILSSNDFPAGSTELSAASIGGIRVQAKNGPGPAPDGALVEVLGCLLQGKDGAWALSNATDPTRIRDVDAPNAEALKAYAARPLGKLSFNLPDVKYYHPDTNKGHEVELRGFVDRRPEGDRIFVNTIQTVALSCP